MSAGVAEVLAIFVSGWLITRMTGRSIWREYVLFMARHPRIFVGIWIVAVHCLMDVVVVLLQVDVEGGVKRHFVWFMGKGREGMFGM